MRNTPLLAPALLLSAALLGFRPAVAATVTWDTSTTAGFQSGNGTWGTNNFWSIDGTTLLPWVSGDDAVFLGGSPAVNNTITIGSNQTVGGLSFGSSSTSGNWILSGSGALTFSGAANFSVAAGSTAQMTSSLVLSPSNILNKTGAGTLVLSNPGLVSANISVNEGVLRLQRAGNAWSQGSITVGGGAELAFAASDTWGNAGTPSAASLVVNNGTISSNGFFNDLGSLTLNGGTIRANGGVIPNFGSFQFNGTVAVTRDTSIVQSGSNANINIRNTVFNVGTGATLDSNAIFQNNQNVLSQSTLTKSGAGTLIMNGASTYAAGTVVTAGTLIVGNSSALGTGGVTVSGGTLNLAGFSLANTITLSGGTISGTQLDGAKLVLQGGEVAGNIVTGAVSKTGAGSVTLSGSNTYAGGTTISAGTLFAGNSTALGSGAVTVAGGTLNLGSSVLANTITLSSGSLAGSQLNGDRLVLQGGQVTGKISGGTLSIAGGGTVTLNALTFSGDANVSVGVGSTAQTTSSLVLSPSNILNKAGAGTLVLSNPGLVSANIRVNEGVLRLQRVGNAWSQGSITVGGGAELAFAASDTWGNAGTPNAASVVVNDGTLSSNGFFNDLGSLTLNGGMIKANGGVIPDFGSFQFNGTVAVTKNTSIVQSGTNANINIRNAVFDVSTGATLDSNATFQNNQNNLSQSTLTKSGAGTLIMNGASTYAAGTVVTAGTLTIGSGSALGSGGVTVSGGILNLAGFSLANTITLSGGTISGTQLDGAKLVLQGGEVAGNIVTGAVSKTGAGSVTLSGSNTYAGGTTISAGTLVLNNANALGTGSVTLAGGVLDVKGQIVSTNIALNANSSLAGDGGTISGVISGANILTKLGSGMLTLTGANSYSGGTTVSAGTLFAGSSTALGSGAVTVAGGALNLGSSVLANTITLSSGSLAGSQLNGDRLVLQGGEVTGVVATGVLSKTGNGTVTLSGSNTFAGGTTISAGTLVLNNANALGTGTVTLSGGNLDVKGQTIAQNISLTASSGITGTHGTISGVISGNGLLTKSGTGTLTLNGNNTFEGGALVKAGTLVVNGEVLGNMVVSAAGKLVGAGVVHDVTVVGGGSINAGTSGGAGTLRADTLALQAGAKVELDFVNATLGAGNGFDQFLVSGALDLSAANLAGKYQLILAGLPVVFDASAGYSFAFIKYGSLNLGSNTSIADLFSIDASQLMSQSGASLDVTQFRLVDDVANQRILLNYGNPDLSPIPEPSTYGLSLGCLGLAIAAVRRRRRKVPG